MFHLRWEGTGKHDPTPKKYVENIMKIRILIVSILLLVSGISAVSAAATIQATDPLSAAGLVYISGYETNPPVFYPGESGTVTVHVTNAANASVLVSQPNLIEPNTHINNQGAFAAATNIGPGATTDYNFVISAPSSEGTFFPLFTVSTNVYGANAINSQLKLKVDATDVRASISARPDTFSTSKKDTVNVSVSNPRTGDITNVLVVPIENGADVTPDETFVGTLKAGSSVQIPFAITPNRAKEITFHVSFNNGDNKHSRDVVLPLNLGENKKGAQVVVNNIETTSSGTTTTLKGDVTNNGLTDAKSVLVTVGSPAKPANPNPVYALGNLAPDDFSSFEVTYTLQGPATSIPLVVEYKDDDGTVFSKTFTIDTSSGTGFAAGGVQNGAAASGVSSSRRGGPFGSFGSGMNQLPVTEIVIILIAIIALIIAWKKGLLKKLSERFRRTKNGDLMPPERKDE
jgi:hypothetical protein